MIGNKEFWKVTVIYSAINSVFATLGAIASQLFTPYNWIPIEISVGCMLTIFGGLAGIYVLSSILDNKKCYVEVL